jgi:hypothetical protein
MDDRWIVWRRKKPIPPGLFWAMFGKFDPSRKNESGDIEFLHSGTTLWEKDIDTRITLFTTEDAADEAMCGFVEQEWHDYGNVLGMAYDYGIDIYAKDRYV